MTILVMNVVWNYPVDTL